MADIADRKDEHLDIARTQGVESGAPTGFGRYRLAYRALPEIALADVDLSTDLLGKRLSAPIIIGAITGGTAEAGRVNRVLAEAAQKRGVALALGSGRIVLERPETAPTFLVRDVAPDILLFANLGAVQLNYGITAADAAGLVHTLGADALNLHLNPLQEAIQPEGDTDFRGLAEAIGRTVPRIPVPVIVKEVGAGIGPETAALLAKTAIAGVETAGVGGTSWATIEALRQDSLRSKQAGMALAAFGVPTEESLLACRKAFPTRVVIASGGLRSAVEMATALALGADACAMALPFLRAASEGGVDEVVGVLDHLIRTLRIVCFVCGARRPSDLRGCAVRLDR